MNELELNRAVAREVIFQSYDRGFEDGRRYEREAILDLAELDGMAVKDIIRAIRERGQE